MKRGDTVSSDHDLPKINETVRILAFLINQPTKEEIKKTIYAINKGKVGAWMGSTLLSSMSFGIIIAEK